MAIVQRTILLFLGVLFFEPQICCAASSPQFDLVVYGATAGGVMTAVAAAREGLRVVLLEPGNHTRRDGDGWPLSDRCRKHGSDRRLCPRIFQKARPLLSDGRVRPACFLEVQPHVAEATLPINGQRIGARAVSS